MRELTTFESLQPLIGTTSESADIDFKGTLDPKGPSKIEFAKDVAALANALGGHLLVGVSCDMSGTRCTGFHGIESELAAEVSKAFEEQVRDRCRPTPVFNVRSIGLPGASKVVLVVTVEASPIAPVGVSLRQHAGGHLVDKGWAFPYRVGSLTQYLIPDQFGVYESMSARRAAAFLASIPADRRNNINLRWVVGEAMPEGTGRGCGNGAGHGGGLRRHFGSLKVQFDSVNLLGNVATFTELGTQHPLDLPLDQIQSVWRKTKEGETMWEVSILGSLHFSEGEWQLWPPT